MRFKMGKSKFDEDDPLILQEWDGTAEPRVNTLGYTVEWKAVLKTKRLGMNAAEDVFLSPKTFWDVSSEKSLSCWPVTFRRANVCLSRSHSVSGRARLPRGPTLDQKQLDACAINRPCNEAPRSTLAGKRRIGELYTGLCAVSAGHVRTTKVIVGEIRTVGKITSY